MPEVDTKLFTEDDILCEFDDPMANSALLDFPPLDLPYIEPEVHMSPPHVAAPHIFDNSSLPIALKPCPKTTPLIKPKLTEKLIQPNYIIEKSVDKKIRYIQKPGTNTIVPVQSVGQIHLPPDHINQVLIFKLCRKVKVLVSSLFIDGEHLSH